MTQLLHRLRRISMSLCTVGCATAGLASVALAAPPATPTVEEALRLAPIQKDVDYDIPTAADAPKCSFKVEKINGQAAWVMRGPNGQILREFVDSNNDGVVDRWSYFKDGIEVYRDIDTNFNKKADQYRWLNTAGTRWGTDKNEDGKVDQWKMISAEEVAAEVVLAMRDRDAARFSRLLLTPAEIGALKLGSARAKELTEKSAQAPATFADIVRRARTVTPKTSFVHFAATKPGVVPAGTDGAGDDIIVYENVVAMIETEGKDGQVQIGTLVKVGDTWRLTDAPTLAELSNKVAGGTFFNVVLNRGTDAGMVETVEGGPSENVQKLMDELSKLDEQLNRASNPSQQAQLNDRRAEILWSIAEEIGEKERPQWIRQYADMISAAAQSGNYPGGVEKLKWLLDKLQSNPSDQAQVPYVKFRYLTADYGVKLQDRNTEYSKVQAEWLENLENFAKEFPKSSDTDEALLQLGIAEEFAGQEDKAKKWYGELIANFSSSPSAAKAQGALTRLNSVGQPIQLRGRTATGQTDDLSKYRGKVVLIQYWATWCEPCKTDMAQLKELYAKYGKNGFAILGVNLDSNPADVRDYLTKNRLPWTQFWEEGGLDSRLANEMGILTLPTMILVDEKGKVVNRNMHITEVEGEIKSRIK